MATFDPGLIDLFTTQFRSNLEMKLQQEMSLLRPRVDSSQLTGKLSRIESQVGALSLKAPVGRYAPLDATSGQYTNRWIAPSMFERAVLIDSFDELQTIIDPKSKLVASLAAAAGRLWDDIIINAAFATATIGTDESNLTTESFSAGTYGVAANFGASAGTGLTVAKLIEAQRILRHYHAIAGDGAPFECCLVIGSQQLSDLQNQVQVVSTDFNGGRVLETGQVPRLLGFDVIVSERLQTDATPNRKCIAFVKSGLHLGLWQDLATRITIRDGLSSQPFQIYVKTMFGATRTQLGKVVQILCADSTGTDPTVIN